MISSLRVRNFRSFLDGGEIELKPLTIFVGRNSSGKSSMLRVLPLLKQSVSVETKEPVLWFGDVDFGSIAQATSRFSDGGITFELQFEGISRASDEVLISEFGERFVIKVGGGGSASIFLDENLPVVIGQRLSNNASVGEVKVVELYCCIGADRLSLVMSPDATIAAIKFNDLELKQSSPASIVVDKKGFFPRFIDAAKPQQSAGSVIGRVRDGPFFTALLASIDGLFHHRVSADGKRKMARSLRFGAPEAFVEHLESTFQSTKARVAALCVGNKVEKVRGLVLLRSLPEIFRRSSQQLDKFCSGVKYIEPVRARASRYYRYQELAVDDIASDGANVPMFLHSLTSAERRDLEQWLSDSLGFAVRAERSGDGHIQLLVQEEGSSSVVNLADTGFGYSQILPIALQLWKTRKSSRDAKGRGGSVQHMIAIEQPELHLHPQMQSMLGDVFALSLKVANSRETGALRLMLETHSEHLINRVGELIEAGKLSSDHAVVYVFEREDLNSPTSVRKVTYNSNGYLQHPWPIGFFLPTAGASASALESNSTRGTEGAA